MSDRTTSTSARLAAEWVRINRCPIAVGDAEQWRLTATATRCLDDVVAAVGGGGDGSKEADLRFRQLVSMAADDTLAARVAIERLRPGLLAIARRRHRAPSAFEDVLAAAWIAVRTYDPVRCNSNLAVSLLADAEWQAFRRHERRRTADPLPLFHGDRIEARSEVHPTVELARLLADARAAGIGEDDLTLIDLLLRNPSVEEIAAQLEVSSRTVRNRRARVAARLRDIALAA